MTTTPETYPHTIKPFEHQARMLRERWQREGDCYFNEQGTAKTKSAIDNACLLYLRGEIDTLLVIAPSGVHDNWTKSEAYHIPAKVLAGAVLFPWFSSKASTKKHENAAAWALAHKGFSLISMSYDAVLTERAYVYLKKVLKQRKVFMVLDESDAIKTPGVKRTKRLRGLGDYAKFRRVLTGTPITAAPFDVYSQVAFALPGFWKKRGLGDYLAFKTFFARFETKFRYTPKGEKQEYPALVNYQNLELLHKWLSEISVRVLKKDVLDLPPKIYQRRYFDLSPEQRRVYKSIRDEAFAVLSSGESITMHMALVQRIRLQQVTCGYLPVMVDEETEEMRLTRIDPNNDPRMDETIEEVTAVPGQKVIVWCKYRRDIEQLVSALGPLAVRYDGTTPSDERMEAVRRFQDPDSGVLYFIGSSAGAAGITLHAAEKVVFHSCSYKARDRWQMEDRAHRAGLTHPVVYVDILPRDTVDEHILENLQAKAELSATILGDAAIDPAALAQIQETPEQLREWLK